MRSTALLITLLLTTTQVMSVMKDYDYLMFATEWQGTVCGFKNCDQDTSVDGVFNLHGLWPNRNDYKHPFSCTRVRFNLNSLPQALQTKLGKYWSGLYSSQQYFLSHEWSKHGTCWRTDYGTPSSMPANIRPLVQAARSAQAQDPKYFMDIAATLASENYNIYSILKDAGIVPSDSRSYNLYNMYDVIAAGLGIKNFQIMCNTDSAGRTSVMEFRVCLSHNFIPVDCYKRKVGGCNKSLLYPTRGNRVASGIEN